MRASIKRALLVVTAILCVGLVACATQKKTETPAKLVVNLHYYAGTGYEWMNEAYTEENDFPLAEGQTLDQQIQGKGVHRNPGGRIRLAFRNLTGDVPEPGGAAQIPTAVHRDPINPSPGIADFPQLIHVLPDAKKGILNRVLGEGPVPQEGMAKAEQGRLVGADQV